MSEMNKLMELIHRLLSTAALMCWTWCYMEREKTLRDICSLPFFSQLVAHNFEMERLLKK